MRKFIVKHFVLFFSFKLFGTTLTGLRATRIIVPLFLISGILTVINPTYPNLTWYTGSAYTLTLLSLYFGFFYFLSFPVKREELDEKQKKQYDKYFNL